jgi:pSer/pThr/pTyr-binding forkhead associated (FHA) protein
VAVCLYAFLGWGLFLLWRDLQNRGISLAARRIPPVNLTIQHEGGETSRRVFQQPEVLLGRGPACDLPLDDDAVSARQARLAYHHGQWWVEDLGSTNGTRLNQATLAAPTVLTSGDQIECGRTALIISIGTPGDPTTPTLRL